MFHVNVIFIWLEFRDTSYIYKERDGSLYVINNVEDVMQILYKRVQSFTYYMELLKMKIKFKNICV